MQLTLGQIRNAQSVCLICIPVVGALLPVSWYYRWIFVIPLVIVLMILELMAIVKYKAGLRWMHTFAAIILLVIIFALLGGLNFLIPDTK